jgi:DNA-directed RNA polymerase specialized sigma24 family protein
MVPRRLDSLDIDADSGEWGRQILMLAQSVVRRWGPLPGCTREDSVGAFAEHAVRVARGDVGRFDPGLGRLSTYLVRSYIRMANDRRRIAAARTRSMRPLSGRRRSGGGFVFDPPARVESPDRVEVADDLRLHLSVLPRKYRRVIEAVYGLNGRRPMTRRDVAAQFGMHRYTIGLYCKCAMMLMREHATER